MNEETRNLNVEYKYIIYGHVCMSDKIRLSIVEKKNPYMVKKIMVI